MAVLRVPPPLVCIPEVHPAGPVAAVLSFHAEMVAISRFPDVLPLDNVSVMFRVDEVTTEPVWTNAGPDANAGVVFPPATRNVVVAASITTPRAMRRTG